MAACLLSLYANAQSILRGFVKDAQGKQVLVGATIELKNSGRHTTTDERGFFQFSQLNPGTYEAEIRFLGFKSVTLPMTVPL